MELEGLGASPHADVLIVGAGAAGCTLGYLLASASKDVLIVEREHVGRKDKLCGGVILTTGLRILSQLFGDDEIQGLAGTTSRGMRALYRGYDATLGTEFFACPRRNLDRFLAERYVCAGGRLVEGADVRVVDEDGHVVLARDTVTGAEVRIAYRTLVGADGASSRIRTLTTGARPQTLISLAGQAPPLPDGSCVLTQRVYPGIAGSCWHIPQGAGAIIGCLFLSQPTELGIPEQIGRVNAFAEELGLPRPALRGAPVPTGSDICLRSAGGTYYAGDAAGLVAPALAAGIHLALQSGLALAQDLCGGEAYEATMAPAIEGLASEAQNAIWPYLQLGVAAMLANERKQGE